MQSNFRVGYSWFALLLLLGVLISTPCLAGSMAGSESVGDKMNEMSKRAKGKRNLMPKVHLLDLKPLPAQRLAKLNKDARTKYDQAMNSLDRGNYDKSFDYLHQAVQAQPDDVYLRFQLVQFAQFMGDTGVVQDDKLEFKRLSAQDYYDLAIENLQVMSTSPQLNVREKQRAMDALATMTALKNSVGEREALRHQAGDEIMKSYAKEAFEPADKRERERQQKSEAVAEYVKDINNPNPNSAAKSISGAATLSSKGNFSLKNGSSGSSSRSSGGSTRSGGRF